MRMVCFISNLPETRDSWEISKPVAKPNWILVALSHVNLKLLRSSDPSGSVIVPAPSPGITLTHSQLLCFHSFNFFCIHLTVARYFSGFSARL